MLVRTQIQLRGQQIAALKQMALQQHVSMSELIRRAVDLFIALPDAGSHQELRQRALAAVGRFHSGHNDVAARHDDYVFECVP